MSKLAISNPVGGTGVFTFVPPATNTNRTITLPDAGGQLHTSESVNDHATMPTVGGDPIVASGSNSDGSWTKWADGTQKATTNRDVHSTTTIDQTLPVTFIGDPYNYAVHPTTIPFGSGSSSQPVNWYCTSPTNVKITLSSTSSNQSSATVIGPWK